MKTTLLAMLLSTISLSVSAEQEIELGEAISPMTDASMEHNYESLDALALEKALYAEADRITVTILSTQRGYTVPIPQTYIDKFCGDIDGCELRMGMYNWDGTGRTASRSNLFYYNTINRVWRSEAGDTAGTDFNGATEHVMQSWACYFTDGIYSNWNNIGDSAIGFGLLSWNQYVADCRLTIID